MKQYTALKDINSIEHLYRLMIRRKTAQIIALINRKGFWKNHLFQFCH